MSGNGEPEATGTARGACLCRKVTFRVTLPSKFCAHCHCPNCRRAHGAAFVTWAGFPSARVEIESGESALVRYRTDTEALRTFCGTCGSTLFYQGPRWPGEVHVALANLDEPIDREPGGHVYVDHAAPWYRSGDTLPRYGGETGVEPKEPA